MRKTALTSAVLLASLGASALTGCSSGTSGTSTTGGRADGGRSADVHGSASGAPRTTGPRTMKASHHLVQPADRSALTRRPARAIRHP
ncbi:hypothetical protein ACWD0J_30530, partial [Streptomyces sp. NPDC003011]